MAGALLSEGVTMSVPDESLIGAALPRLEDGRHLTGGGRFVADLDFDGGLHAAFVRSPVAHAAIAGIDCAEARSCAGVRLVLTGEDVAAAGLGPLPCLTPVDSRDGTPFAAPVRPLLCRETVRHVGDSVAMVVADRPAAAEEAAALVAVKYDERPVQTDPALSTELAFDWEMGDGAAVDAAIAAAAHRVEMTVVNNRVVVAPLEPRAVVGLFEDAVGYTLVTQSQGVHFLAGILARQVLKIEPERLRVVTPDVGGSFGMKLMAYPEQALVLHAARLTGRPVKWVGSRTDAFVTDLHGRAQVSRAVLALDADHRITALRVETRGDLGAYASTMAPSIIARGFSRVLGHTYRIPAIHLVVEGVFTHTTPVDAYRGAGKPEAVSVVERLMDRAARECGIDRVDLRARNLVTTEEMPYRTALGLTYDTGDFPHLLRRALAEADWAGFAARRRHSEAAGLRRGIGLGLYLHTTGGDTAETSEVTLMPDRTVRVRSGTQASGQGHETAYAQIVAQRLGIAPDRVVVEQGDSRTLPRGGGTGGSSSLPIAGVTIRRATEAMLEEARGLAADRLEAAAVDVEFGKGRFTVVGTDRSVHLVDLASSGAGLGERICGGLAEFEGENTTFPNGAYVCEVELDPETGAVAIVGFTGVDDIGTVLNPLTASGQIQGGIAQGIGQAVLEHVVYDPESGQLLSGAFTDYGLPRADDLPGFRLVQDGVPTTNNPLGMKGAGEIGTIGAPGAVINAVADAIGHDRIDMPATPERVWRALREG